MILEAFFLCSNFFLNLDPSWQHLVILSVLEFEYLWLTSRSILASPFSFLRVSRQKSNHEKKKKAKKTFTRLICTMSTRSPNMYSYFWPAHFRVPRYLARNEFRLGKIFFCLYPKKTKQNERKFTRSHFSCA